MHTAKDVLAHLWDGALPVRPDVFAASMGVRVVGAADLDISGMVEICDGKPLITYNTSEPPMRQRFTVAHELGHVVLGHLTAAHPKFRDSAANFSSSAHQREERDANRFAAQLLIPADTVEYAVVQKKIFGIAQLAKIFGVSPIAMEYRLKNLGLI